MNKEVFIIIRDGFIQWYGPNTSGSEPFNGGVFNTLTTVVNALTAIAASRNEHWNHVFSTDQVK